MNETPVKSSSNGKTAIAAFLLTAFFIFLAIEQVLPPAPVPASAPPTQFSAGRAMELLRVIARAPHPTGSEENNRVRNFLVTQLTGLGFEAKVQTANVVWQPRRQPIAVPITVNNIVARLKGTGSTRAVMLSAHYDSVPTGPGASDDGSGVVALLETARALKSGPPLRNDLLIVFTDSEENASLGARSLVDESPWIKDVGVVLNFEARGSCGPSLMFETSSPNGLLIESFAAAASHAVANSAFPEIYKRLHNYTDLTVFKQAGMPGLNFAYSGCWPRYHSQRDDVANISGRSLQHDGVQALALTRRFGNLDLTQPQTPSKQYFSLFGHLVYYPEGWVAPFTVLALMLFLGVVGFGLHKRLLTTRGILAGVVVWLGAAAAAALLSQGVWAGIRSARLVYLLPDGMPYHGELLTFGFMALTLAVMAAGYAWLRRINEGDVTVGAFVWWALLAALTAVRMPGANFLFLWPLVAGALGLGYTFRQKSTVNGDGSVLVWALPALVGILIFFPLLYGLVMGVTTTALPITTLMTALLIGFLIPMVRIMTAQRRWALAGASLVAAMACLVTAIAGSGASALYPRTDSIFYALNADSGKAVWASLDRVPDAWTRQFLSGKPVSGNLDEFVYFSAPLIEHPAPAAELAPAQLRVVTDITTGGRRALNLQIVPHRSALYIEVRAEKGNILAARVNGRRLREEPLDKPGSRWTLGYGNPPANGFALALEVKAGEPITLRVTQQTDGLPHLTNTAFHPRPEDLMPSPAARSDSTTLVIKTFVLPSQIAESNGES